MNKNTYIISAMGTGKTDLLKQYIDEHWKDEYILYVTFRKTLTNATCARFGFKSYEDFPVNKSIAFDQTMRGLVC